MFRKQHFLMVPNQHAICAARTCTRSMDMNMDMQHGHGHAAWTWTCSMDKDMHMGIDMDYSWIRNKNRNRFNLQKSAHVYKDDQGKKQAKNLWDLIQLKITVLGTSPKSYYLVCTQY